MKRLVLFVVAFVFALTHAWQLQLRLTKQLRAKAARQRRCSQQPADTCNTPQSPQRLM